MSIKLLNIQGLTQVKAIEIERILTKNSIICLTGTQQKLEKINFSQDIRYITSMRSMQDKRGGGLMVLWRDDYSITLTKVDIAQSDILIVQCKIQGTSFILVPVYMSVNDYNKNNNIYQYIQSNLVDCPNYIILGDFNGHTGFLGPHTMNKNGEAMLDFIDRNNLILLNGHAECLGEITWQQNEKKSTIDYIITNTDMHRRFVTMHIDEDREEFDLSDHNLLIAEFNINTSSCKQYSDDDYKEISYIKMNEETTKHFMALVKSKIETLEGDITLEHYESILKDATSKSMLKTIKRRLAKKNSGRGEDMV